MTKNREYVASIPNGTRTEFAPITCTRCGRKHVTGWTYLELDSWTNRWDVPGGIAPDRSQGLFPFGTRCAKRQLAPVGTNPRQRGDDDGVEYADPREVL